MHLWANMFQLYVVNFQAFEDRLNVAHVDHHDLNECMDSSGVTSFVDNCFPVLYIINWDRYRKVHREEVSFYRFYCVGSPKLWRNYDANVDSITTFLDIALIRFLIAFVTHRKYCLLFHDCSSIDGCRRPLYENTIKILSFNYICNSTSGNLHLIHIITIG